jgi:hypothetical protein
MEDWGHVDAMGERWLQGSEERGTTHTCDDGGERERERMLDGNCMWH